MDRQNLIFDADDTLWENNIYFEEAFEQFCEYLAHTSMTPDQVRGVLDEIEIANAKVNGYGSKNFAENLARCFEHLTERDISERDLRVVKEFAYEILSKPLELIPGVAETLPVLAERHHLTIFTKGDHDEQQFKIDSSGLARYFNGAGIVKEKNVEAYRHLTETRGFAAERTWMIGNSPKSDINPALEAGLKAVFVPHARTWTLERAQIPEEHPRLLRVTSIADLTRHF